MTHQFKAGEKARIVKLRGFDESAGYKVDDIIIIDRIRFPEPAYKDKKGRWFFSDQLAPVFEVGDTVQVVKKIYGGRFPIGHIGRITEVRKDHDDYYRLDEGMGNNYSSEELKLIKKGAGMSFRKGDRIRMKKDCQNHYLLKGEEGEVVEGVGCDFQVKGEGSNYCSCQNLWEKVELEVGDEVEIVNPDKISINNGYSKGTRFIINIITQRYIHKDLLYSPINKITGLLVTELKLIKKGAGMSNLRDRIEALTGWDKEGEEIFQKVKGGYYLQMNNLSDTSGRFMINPTYKTPYMDFMNNTYEVQFAFQSSCEKLRAFKDALLWLLDKSGKEKSKVKSALEAEIKELKDKLAGLERKIEEVGR